MPAILTDHKGRWIDENNSFSNTGHLCGLNAYKEFLRGDLIMEMKIKNLEVAIDVERSRLESIKNEIVDELAEMSKNLVDNRLNSLIAKHSDYISVMDVEKLREFKVEITQFSDEIPKRCRAALLKENMWPHQKLFSETVKSAGRQDVRGHILPEGINERYRTLFADFPKIISRNLPGQNVDLGEWSYKTTNAAGQTLYGGYAHALPSTEILNVLLKKYAESYNKLLAHAQEIDKLKDVISTKAAKSRWDSV
ncbi:MULTISPECIES: hypothetical protein [unclassified Inquilinus]|uniref:hypothetical protein n=1 Tax=unclassified Inquilinus TaxID=2645927 RepID=UPI003F8FCFFD